MKFQDIFIDKKMMIFGRLTRLRITGEKSSNINVGNLQHLKTAYNTPVN